MLQIKVPVLTPKQLSGHGTWTFNEHEESKSMTQHKQVPRAELGLGSCAILLLLAPLLRLLSLQLLLMLAGVAVLTAAAISDAVFHFLCCSL